MLHMPRRARAASARWRYLWRGAPMCAPRTAFASQRASAHACASQSPAGWPPDANEPSVSKRIGRGCSRPEAALRGFIWRCWGQSAKVPEVRQSRVLRIGGPSAVVSGSGWRWPSCCAQWGAYAEVLTPKGDAHLCDRRGLTVLKQDPLGWAERRSHTTYTCNTYNRL